MRKLNIFFTLFLLSGMAGSAQIAGSWNGKLATPMSQLTLVVHIADSAGKYTATMDSPDQNARGIPVSKITFQDNTLYFEVGNGVITYDGTLVSDSISGTFKQSGMSFPLTLRKGSIEAKAHVRPQEPKPPFPYKSENIRFSNPEAGGIQLAGTLTLPEKGSAFPAVILISGSGPQDRNSTVMEHKIFLVIADYLTRHGIAVLRFDDRGTAESQGDFAAATTADFATDVQAAFEYLKDRKEIDTKKIGLIGHSEGGIVAPMVAAKNKEVAFMILLAGPGFTGKEIMAKQNAALARQSGSSPERIDQLVKGNREIYNLIINAKNDATLKEQLIEKISALLPETMTPEQKSEIAHVQAAQMSSPWMKYFLANDPTDYLKKIKIPVLALNGSHDIQVPAEENIAAIKNALQTAGNKKVTTHIFPGLNHLFQHARTGMPDEYIQIEETFAPEVLKFMAEWMEGVGR